MPIKYWQYGEYILLIVYWLTAFLEKPSLWN